MKNSFILAALSVLSISVQTHAQPVSPEAQGAAPFTNRLVVTLKPQVKGAVNAPKLTATLGSQDVRELKLLHSLSNGAGVYDLGSSVGLTQAQDIARRIQSNPAVQSAEPDVRVHLAAIADPGLSAQWGLFNSTSNQPGAKGGMDAFALWQRTRGANTTVAVLDTGIVQHPKLAGRISPGYDFISDVQAAGDNDYRDADPTDPGDFCEGDNGLLLNQSSWHGTRVAGIIAAAANNQGISGVAPLSKILNVRVMGRCGGWLSDVADAIRWTAGLEVPGIPRSTHGPLVMNLSLSSATSTACPAFMQRAINDAAEAGSIVVATAGNAGKNAIGSPGNCSNIVTVTAHTGSADLAVYSNYAPIVTVSGPAGGNCRNDQANCFTFPALTLGVVGRTVFEDYSALSPMAGTSAAAPFVTAVLGGLRELEPTLRTAEAISMLRNSSRQFPATSFCYENTQCGFGMLDAGLLLAQLDEVYVPTVSLTPSLAQSRTGNTIQLTAIAASKSSAARFTYAWAQKSGPTVMLHNSGAVASFTSPNAKDSLVFEVLVTDSQGRTARAQTSVAVSNGQAPLIQAVPPQTSFAGEGWSVTPAVTDADNDFDRLVILQAPSGMAVEGGRLVWPSGVTGTYSVRVVAVDKEGLESAEISFTLVVAPRDSERGASAGSEGGARTGLLGFLLLAAAFGVKRVARRGAP